MFEEQEREVSNMTYQSKTHKRKRYRITSKFRFITSLVIMLGLLITGLNCLSGINESTALTKTEYATVEIVFGDTLWDIANTYKSNNTDTRKAIYEICEINNIDASDLTPGMIIKVPENL